MDRLYLVDGFNLLHSVILRGKERKEWWRSDHQSTVVAFVDRLRDQEAWVIFDARNERSQRCDRTDRVQVFFAPSADDYIVQLCELHRGQRAITVVSADRSLVDRATHRGADRLSPWLFAAVCARSARR